MATKRSPAKAGTKTVPVSQIPEASRYIEAEDKLQEFIAAHQKEMDELSVLVEQRNEALQEANDAIRGLCVEWGVGINCGPFRFKHFMRKVNFEKMFDTLGKDDFSRFSGAVKTVPSYTGDRDTVLRAIDTAEIPPEQADEFYSSIPTYVKIEPLVLP